MKALIAYAARTGERPYYFANDHSRDHVQLAPIAMPLIDGRAARPTLDREGFVLVGHSSAIADFSDVRSCVYRDEIVALIGDQSSADCVVVTAPGVLRFSETSAQSGTLDNSRPARFAHVDVSDATAAEFAARSAPGSRPFRRFAHYNVWRMLSDPPQDVPLALCDAHSTARSDLIAADAIFDVTDRPEWSFEGWVVAHNSAHRWYWFADMTREEALVFKINDSAPNQPHCVPHVAFDNPACPPGTPPRASIEMRATAYWWA